MSVWKDSCEAAGTSSRNAPLFWSSLALLALAWGCDHNPCVNGGDIEVDTDGDTVPDCVEQDGVDIDDDGTVDAVTNTNPMRKDIFIKIDWMDCGSDTADTCSDGHDHAPDQDALDDVVQAFADATVPNPDSSTGIDLQIEMGEALTHEEVCDCDCIADLVDNQRQVLSAAERAADNADQILEAKRKIVHYFLWSHQHTEGSGSSGVACNNGYTHVSLGTWTNYGSRTDQAGTFMHELGHQLGLPHGGSDGVNDKPNYLSVMNYAFQTSYSGRLAALDYSTSALDALDEDDLDESVGIGANDATQTRIFNFTRDRVDVNAQGGIDWNQDGDMTDTVTMGLDINNDGVCIKKGDDDFLDSRVGGDDLYFAKNRSGWMVLSDTSRAAANDDDKWTDAGSGETRVSTGPDTILDTSVEAGDTLVEVRIVNGPDRTCDSSVSGDDEEVRSSGTAETRILTGFDDWDAIQLDLLFNSKGGLGDTPPSPPEPDDKEPELTFEQSLQLKPSDVVVEVGSEFTARRGELLYQVTVSNDGPEATKGPAHVDLFLPGTAANVSCLALDEGTCVLTEPGDKVLIDTPQLEAGDSHGFLVMLTVDASLCDTPEAYTAAVGSSILNVEVDESNDTFEIPFADVDGDGIIDVCKWPISDFSILGEQSVHVGNRAEVLEQNGAFAHGIVAKRENGTSGLGQFRVGVEATTGDVVTNGDVVLLKAATVDGNVVAAGRVVERKEALVLGTTTEGEAPSPELPELVVAVDFPPAVIGYVMPAAGASEDLAPGRYGDVIVGPDAELVLSTGDYVLDSLDLQPGGSLYVDASAGPVRIFVQSSLLLEGLWTSTDSSGVLLAFVGDADVSVNAELGATVLAPSAHVKVGTGMALQFAGAILAAEVVIHPDVLLTHQAFHGQWPWNP